MPMSITYVKHFTLGEVPKVFVDKVLQIVSDFLEIANSIDYLEVYFYSSTEDKILFLEEEALELGVIAVGDFVAMHEAWRGWPRIHIDFSRCLSLSDKHLRAVVIHEVSHAVLHGSPTYYYISIPFIHLPQLSFEQTAELIYLVTTAVKDLDVHDFITRLGMVNVLEDFVDFFIAQYKNLSCNNLEDVIQLAKVLTPCLFLNRCRVYEIISKECLGLSSKILEALKNFVENRVGDISMDTQQLLGKLLNILSNFINST
ncbi:MAG: hypothetical protein QW775_04390 [Ignisphaera sp.]|uniref:Uncharacterized protein n=1 Tax=Ignisphaera aggregans TaxID=334771 RepID=A0A7C4NTX8_9CREN